MKYTEFHVCKDISGKALVSSCLDHWNSLLSGINKSTCWSCRVQKSLVTVIIHQNVNLWPCAFASNPCSAIVPNWES